MNTSDKTGIDDSPLTLLVLSYNGPLIITKLLVLFDYVWLMNVFVHVYMHMWPFQKCARR